MEKNPNQVLQMSMGQGDPDREPEQSKRLMARYMLRKFDYSEETRNRGTRRAAGDAPEERASKAAKGTPQNRETDESNPRGSEDRQPDHRMQTMQNG